MNIILYLINIIQHQSEQIAFLLKFIRNFIPHSQRTYVFMFFNRFSTISLCSLKVYSTVMFESFHHISYHRKTHLIGCVFFCADTRRRYCLYSLCSKGFMSQNFQIPFKTALIPFNIWYQHFCNLVACCI